MIKTIHIINILKKILILQKNLVNFLIIKYKFNILYKLILFKKNFH
jgi:hypothetical protein